MKTFFRVIEVWIPAADGSLLEFGSGLFGAAPAFGAVTRAMCFGRGEGLPGRAWDEGQPVVLAELGGGYFRRAAAAKAAGLGSAIALPFFAGEALTAVMVIFCGQDEARSGAIELWRNDPRVTTDLTLVDGAYADEAFSAVSHDASLPRGAGLPGLAWQRGASVVLNTLSASKHFLRAADAAGAGLDRGLALPCAVLGQAVCIASFLSGAATPIAARIETWQPDADGRRLQRSAAFCERVADLASVPATLALDDNPGAIGQAFVGAAPVVCEALAGEPAAVGEPAVRADLQALVAIPVIWDGAVSEVLVLYF